jgi:hypothetical protein
MSEKLEGRVTLEKTDQDIRFGIPVRRGPFGAIYGPLVVIWLILATVRYWHLLAGPHPEDTNFDLQMIAIGIYVLGAVYFLGWLSWTMTGETLVILSPPEIKIQVRVFGIELSSRTFQISQVNRLRFVPHRRLATQPSVLNPNSSWIRFDVNRKPQNFGKGVTEDEARAVIDKMLEICEYPRGWF